MICACERRLLRRTGCTSKLSTLRSFIMPSHSVVFAEPVRTAIGTFGGSLKDVPAPALGAVATGAAVKRAGLNPDEVETVVMGNVVQAGTKMNPARQAAVHASLPVQLTALPTHPPWL